MCVSHNIMMISMCCDCLSVMFSIIDSILLLLLLMALSCIILVCDSDSISIYVFVYSSSRVCICISNMIDSIISSNMINIINSINNSIIMCHVSCCGISIVYYA